MTSIPAIMEVEQDPSQDRREISPNIPIVVEATRDLEPDEQAERPNKYLYSEFAGFAGERLLKSILRKILPNALYRTWEILADHQAPGNDAFLGIIRLSEYAARQPRTIRLNIHELEARRLLSLRAEPKLLADAFGQSRVKLVVIKDFAGLYTLAHEYYEWSRSDCYIEPERDFVDVLKEDQCLVRKLRRFNNYRRLLDCSPPGPEAQPKPIHSYYTDYDPTGKLLEDAPQDQIKEDAAGAQDDSSRALGNLYLHNQLHNQLQKDSQERIKTMATTKLLKEGSFDSEGSLEPGGDGYTKSNRHASQERENETVEPNPTNPFHSQSEEMGRAGQQAQKYQKRQQSDLDARAQQFVERAMAVAASMSGKAKASPTKPKGNRLVSAFVGEIATPLGDRNVKGSRTRALRVVEHVPLSRIDTLACLVKAYLVALETKTVKPQHRHPDGDNRMPLFCSMFSTFVEQLVAGRFHYDVEHLLRDIARDDRLALFAAEHHLDTELLAHPGEETEQLQTEEVMMASEEVTASVSGGFAGEKAQEMVSEQISEPEPVLEVEAPELGWSTSENAHWWGNRLRETLGEAAYCSDVIQTQYGRWAVVLWAHDDVSQQWVYLTADQAREDIRAALDGGV